ncbi:MAG: hypothetical protein QOF02_2523 [Blastocatellia bacterium]|jgi:hypothetical protein|nr:hypothetical protein [Blastocatellia bacterium]
MKACPACNRTYADETLTFCLVDGSILSAPYDPHETLRVNAPRNTDPAPTEILSRAPGQSGLGSPSLSTMQAPQPPPLYAGQQQQQQSPLKERQGGKRRAAIFIGICLALMLGAGIVLSLSWLLKEDAADNQREAKIPNANVRPTVTPTATPTPKIFVGDWGQRNETASLNGVNLTYYRGTTPEQCQADCDKNAQCRGYTFIRAGAYNPNDAAMCYLASVVTEMVTHPCCISAVKR